MASKRKDRITINERDQFRVLELKGVEIWDGADLALLRDTLTELIERGCCCAGVVMSSVKYIPSGFFGMLFDWQDRGVSIRLYDPQPNVNRMLWFQQFFEHIGSGVYSMRTESNQAGAHLPQQWDYSNWNKTPTVQQPSAPAASIKQ
ncbi:MAG: hypothetical protein ABGZ17_11205 [Planctomycetaceae bacterium]